MADDRPVSDPIEALAALVSKVADLESTLMARVSRRPTGTIEGILLPAALPDTLLLDGSTYAQSAYPALWKWISNNGLVGLGVFGSSGGNFTVPDYRNRVPRGSASAAAPGLLVGADSVTLTVNQMPAHDHGSAGGHSHSIGSDGSHGGHTNAPASTTVQNGTASSYTLPTNYNTGSGSHDHGGGTGSGGGHSHASQGNGNAVDVRQASFGLNFVVWT